MLTKYEIEEEELKPKIKHPEPEFHLQYNVTDWRPITATQITGITGITGTQIPNPVYVDYYGVHDVPTLEPIEYSPPTAYTIEDTINYLPF